MNYANYFCTIWEVGAFLLGKLARIYSTTCSSEASTKHSLFELCPKGGIALALSCLLRRIGIVFDEPGEILCIVDFVVEHLLTAGGEESFTS